MNQDTGTMNQDTDEQINSLFDGAMSDEELAGLIAGVEFTNEELEAIAKEARRLDELIPSLIAALDADDDLDSLAALCDA